jgi:putative transcription factor
VIEGANMSVCDKCAKLGSGYWEPKPKQRAKKKLKHQPVISYSRRKPRAIVTTTLELVSDVGQRVRQAREEAGLSHEDLGRKTSEKVSVLRKIEIGKMVPDLGLAEKLEHTLKITLRVPAEEPKVQTVSSSKPHGTTLGDIIQFKLKDEEAET